MRLLQPAAALDLKGMEREKFTINERYKEERWYKGDCIQVPYALFVRLEKTEIVSTTVAIRSENIQYISIAIFRNSLFVNLKVNVLQ